MSTGRLENSHWKDFNFNPSRLKKMQEGAEIIKNFLNIALTQGLLRSDILSKQNLTELSTRLIDTQIPTAARKVKMLIDLEMSPDNIELYKCELRWLGHVATSLSKFDKLSLAAKLELWQVAGGVIAKDLVMQQPAIEDSWTVKSIDISKEDSLTTRKIWLLGHRSGLWCYILDFAFGDQKLPETFHKSSKPHGLVHFYPGLTPGRVLFQTLHVSFFEAAQNQNRFSSISEMKIFLAKTYATNVFLQEIPITLSDIKTTIYNDEMIICDSDNYMLTINSINKKYFSLSPEKQWENIAISAGRPISIDLLYSKEQFYLIS